MTTTATSAPGLPRARRPRVLLAAVSCVVVLVALIAGVAGATQGSAAAGGALVGGGIACAFFSFGSLVVNAAVRMAPQAALAVAMMTYTLQLVLVLVVFIALSESGAVGDTLSAGWISGGVIVAALAWTVGQMVASARARIPAYDIELPGTLSTAVTETAQPPARPQEVSAS